MGLLQNLRDDIVYIGGALRTLKTTTPIAKHPTRVFPALIDGLAERFGDAPALLSDRESFTYRALADRANRFSRWALAQGLTKGDTVCLLMPNRPEYLAVWLGVTHAGGIVALININLVGPSLAHCIDIVTPKHVVVAAELVEPFRAVQSLLNTAPKVWLHGSAEADFPRVDLDVAERSGAPLSAAERRELTIEDRALYIYTSGTTGLPKAANINHYRLMLACNGFAGIMDTKATDRMYDCLPLYHTAGGLCATGSLLVNGGSVVIRDKFSAREFWNDFVRWDCTLFQYIGELCRYLANSPPNSNETRHRLRLACGNGLRPDVWEAFQTRFHIPRIIEFYAATEGNVSMINFDGKPGAVGRLPWFVAFKFPTAIVRFDVTSERPVRGADGFCIKCAANEIGEAIGKIINDPSKPANRFEGYANKAEDERKILRDVFEKGDAWFRSGDLMRQDERGYFYFIDRVGDTYRWKGENVSTSEVAETIDLFPGVAEANIYGVQIAGKDGRAGMAAIVTNDGLDLAALREHIVKHLPDYARPVFLRIQSVIEVTGTFKQKKTDLVREGFDPTLTADALYFHDPERRAFVVLDGALYGRIQNGEVRV